MIKLASVLAIAGRRRRSPSAVAIPRSRTTTSTRSTRFRPSSSTRSPTPSRVDPARTPSRRPRSPATSATSSATAPTTSRRSTRPRTSPPCTPQLVEKIQRDRRADRRRPRTRSRAATPQEAAQAATDAPERDQLGADRAQLADRPDQRRVSGLTGAAGAAARYSMITCSGSASASSENFDGHLVIRLSFSATKVPLSTVPETITSRPSRNGSGIVPV